MSKGRKGRPGLKPGGFFLQRAGDQHFDTFSAISSPVFFALY
jgi:hypothetical protein